MSEWIDVRENPPPRENGKYIIAAWNNVSDCELPYLCLKYYNRAWVSDENEHDNFDYWMPWDPPALPKNNHYCAFKDKYGEILRECKEIEGSLYLWYQGFRERGNIPVNFCPICGKGVYNK